MMSSETASTAENALQGAMQDQACQWLTRLRSDSVGDADYQDFALWLAANPKHREAMDAAQQLWGDLAVLELYEARHTPARRTGRRAWLAGAVSLAAGLMLAVVLLPQFNSVTESVNYQTRVGETLDIDLDDGSSVKLNTDTTLAVDYSDQQRTLELRQGEAFFQVAHDANRPFVVRAANIEVRALGTAFNIHVLDNGSVVTVSEGVVRVTELSPPASRPPQTGLLYSDQRMTGASSGLSAPAAIDVTTQLAWRDGKLVAEKMSLGTLVQELSRYHTGRIFIAEPGLANKTISGVFLIEDLDGILVALEHTAQVRSITLDDGSIQLIGAPL